MLNKIKWDTFFFDSLFILEVGNTPQVPTGALIPDSFQEEGNTPRITATSKNNGINNYFISNHNNFKTFHNFISASFLGTVFYHPYKASIDMKIHCLQLNKYTLDKYLGLFLVRQIKSSIADASYGNQISSTDLPRKKILLPVNKSEQPHYQFMKNYTKSVIEEKKKKYLEYCHNEMQKLVYKKIKPLEEKIWKEFFIVDIFKSIQRGKRLIKKNQIEGDYPYVSSTAFNNGTDGFIGNEHSIRLFENCITVANSGSVGSTFFHPYKFVASDHVTHLKNENMDKFTYLFISAQIKRLSGKYGFNREINDTRISREKIMLPVNRANKPDFEYMSQYMMNLEYKKRNDYIAFVRNEDGINL